jgi:hypothetical protein
MFPGCFVPLPPVTTEKSSQIVPREIRFYDFIICKTIDYNANPHGEQQKYLTSSNMQLHTLHRKPFFAAGAPVFLLFSLVSSIPGASVSTCFGVLE